MRGRRIFVLAATAVLGAAAIGVVVVTSGPVAFAGTGQITGFGGKCVDVSGANSANGTRVQLWTCNGTGAQSWTVGTDGTIRALGKCMDVSGAGTADNTRVQLWTCNGTGAQNWTSSGGTLVNPNSNKCLTPQANGTGDGTQLVILTCNGGTNQRWTLPS